MENDVKDLCKQMGLEFINALTEISSKEKYYVIYDPQLKDEMLYSYNELKSQYNYFLNK